MNYAILTHSLILDTEEKFSCDNGQLIPFADDFTPDCSDLSDEKKYIAFLKSVLHSKQVQSEFNGSDY